jgi:hypothetical protein
MWGLQVRVGIVVMVMAASACRGGSTAADAAADMTPEDPRKTVVEVPGAVNRDLDLLINPAHSFRSGICSAASSANRA